VWYSFRVPWIVARLRGQKVLARANGDGSLVVEDGRVEIRYKPADGRAYRAGARNLEPVEGEAPLPDDHCAHAADPTPSSDKSAGKGASKTAGTQGTKGAAPIAIPSDAWIAYTDGACSGNPGPAGLGLVVLGPAGERADGYEYLGEATNNVAELTAILRAIEAVPNAATIVIHTDSQYAIGVLSKGWKAKANVALVASIKSAIAGRGRVRFVYVPGHAGVELNERADELAREAIATRRTQPAVVLV
jgi:ribonuclease HI